MNDQYSQETVRLLKKILEKLTSIDSSAAGIERGIESVESKLDELHRQLQK